MRLHFIELWFRQRVNYLGKWKWSFFKNRGIFWAFPHEKVPQGRSPDRSCRGVTLRCERASACRATAIWPTTRHNPERVRLGEGGLGNTAIDTCTRIPG